VGTKETLKAELVKLLAADVEAAERARQTTVDGVTHEEARPENDKDTRALEQSYLAHGQAKRASELRTELALVESMPIRAFAQGAPIALGALVTVSEDDKELKLFIAPARGGTALGGGVQAVSVSSPLGRALLGKTVGDECEVTLAQKVRTLDVIAVE